MPKAVIHRAFAVLNAFDDLRGELTLTELSEITGLPKATLYRIGGQLVDVGALERTEHGYRIGIRLYEMGTLAPRHRRLREAAMPFIEDLHTVTQSTIHFGILDGLEVVYLERLSGHRQVAVATRSGGRLPAHCTGLGKAILAFSPPDLTDQIISAGLDAFTGQTITTRAAFVRELSKIRQDRIAFDDGEYSAGIYCAAAPILNRGSLPIASISVTMADSMASAKLMAPAVKATSLALSRRIQKMPDHYWGS